MDVSIDAIGKELIPLISMGYFGKVAQVLSKISDPQLQAEALAKTVAALTAEDRFDVIRDIDSRLSDFSSRYISLFGSAIQDGIEGNIVELDLKMKSALTKISEAKKAGLPIYLPFAQPVLLHAAYVDTAEVLRCAEKAETIDEGIFDGISLKPSTEWIVLLSCNGLYFDRFAPRYLKSLKLLTKRLHVHIQLSAPTCESESLFKKLLKDLDLEGSLALDSGNPKPVSLISRRFQIAAQMMKRFGLPILITDLDIEVRASVNQLLNLDSSTYEVALFEFPKRPAMLTSHCSLVLFQPTPRVQIFLNLLSHYLAAMLLRENRLWMLDQIAMFTISRMVMGDHVPQLDSLHWKDLHLLLGAPLENFQIEQSLESDEKESLRRQAWPDFRSIDVLDIVDDVLRMML